MAKRLPLVALIALFMIIGTTIYSRVILNGVFLFDDFEYVINNPIITDMSSTNMSDPRQIGYFTFALNYALGGEDPRGYHIFNVAVHIINSLLVYFLGRTIVRGLTKGHEPPPVFDHAALLAALLFLVHPVQTQAVSYVTQRFTSLATLFYLLAVWLYLTARIRLESKNSPGASYGFYAASILITILAMKTKEISFTVPFLLLLLEVLVLKDSRFQRRRFVFLIPFAATLIIIPLSIFGPDWGLVSRSAGVADTTRMEKLYDLTERSPFHYLFTQFRAVIVYVRLLLVPFGLRVVYDFPVSRSFFEARVIASFFSLIAFLCLAVYCWRKSLLMRDDQESKLTYSLVSLGIFWFFITISVESSVIPIKDVIFEHRVYLPSVGFFMAFALVVMRFSGRIFGEKSVLLKAAVPALILLVPLMVSTFVRNKVWTDEVKLWDDVVRKSPNKPIGYNNRGNAYAKRGEYGRALEDFSRAIEFFPKSFDALSRWENSDMTPSNMAKTYTARGDAYIALGDYLNAKADFRTAKEIFVMPLFDLENKLKIADLYARKGAFKHALDEYDRILELHPENLRALNDRANTYSRTKRFSEAIRDLSRVIAFDPDFVLAYHNRGIAYAWSGKRELAVSDFNKACKMGFEPACRSVEFMKSAGR